MSNKEQPSHFTNSDRPDIAIIRKRCEEATAGPWHHHRDGIISDVLAPCSIERFRDDPEMRIVIAEVAKAFSNNHEDAAFIAAARSDMPALCGYVDRLEEDVRRLKALLESCEPYIHAAALPSDEEAAPDINHKIAGQLLVAVRAGTRKKE